MANSRFWMLAVVVVGVAGCGRAGCDRAGAKRVGGSDADGVAAVASAGEEAPRPSMSAANAPSSTAPPHAPRLAFEHVAKELRCEKEAGESTTLAMKENQQAEGACLKAAAVRELDKFLLPLKTSDAARFEAWMGDQADFNRYATDVCDVSEDASWIDVATGRRDYGSMYGVSTLSCQQQLSTERYFFAKSLNADDPTSLLGRANELASRAAKAETLLGTLRGGLERLKPVADAGNCFGQPGCRIDVADRRQLIAKIDRISKGATKLAQGTCAHWSSLAEAARGDASCRATLRAYYLGHETYEPTWGESGD